VAEKINPPNLREEAVKDEGNVKVVDGVGRRSCGDGSHNPFMGYCHLYQQLHQLREKPI
jgi:hypothetical protein